MGYSTQKKNRVLDVFYRAMKGENISIRNMAAEYGVSTKSTSRDMNEIKNFLSDNRELVGNIELKYAANSKSYYLEFDNFLQSKELVAMIKMMIGCRALSKIKILEIITKLKFFTTYHDRTILDKLIAKEIYHYNEVNRDCNSVINSIWQLTRCIDDKTEITITYYKIDRKIVERKIKPIAIIFSDFYYYLIAYHSDGDDWKAIYYRVDRIVNVIEHRTKFELDKEHSFDEGELRSKIQFMFPGEYRRIRFEYSGPSVQAILDKLPTAKVIEVKGNIKIVEAETYGTGINMYLLSQGSMVKAIAPYEFVEEMKLEIEKMNKMYYENQ